MSEITEELQSGPQEPSEAMRKWRDILAQAQHPRRSEVERCVAINTVLGDIEELLAMRAASPDQTNGLLREDAEFLCARIRELEGEMTDDGELSRQYFGHVLPAVARLEDALASTSTARIEESEHED